MAHEIRTVAHSGHVADNPNTYSYSGSFDVFKGIEVKVTLDNVVLTHTASTINESASPREYTVDTTAKTIHIGGGNLTSGEIRIIPTTDLGQLPGSTAPKAKADYTPGSSITSEDLNNNQLQLMRRALEYDEQKLDTAGGTMTGNLHFGKDIDLSFEGSTDNAYETTLTVVDPTADRTITLPNVSGTVVTTGDTATVTATMLAANSVDSSELVDGSIDTSHFSTGAVDSAAIANGTITNDDISTSAGIQFTKFEDLDSAKILVGNGSNKATEVAVSGDVTISNTGAVTIANDAVEQSMIADDAVGADQLASNAVVSDSIADGSIVNADVNASAAIAHSKLAAIPDGQILVGSGSTVPTAVAMSGDATISNSGAVTIANDAVEIGMIGCEQTTISDSDSHIPTSGAVVDYVAAQIAPIGGLEVIADDESFPNTIAPAGVVISITDAAGLQVNSSGVSTNADTLDNSTVTINGFPSELRGGVGSNPDPYVFQSGAGLMVKSTGSSHTYDYHQALIRESDFVQLSDDINDFNNRYRIGTRTANDSNTNDDGDLFFDTGTNKMYVYDGAYDSGGSWKEVTSAGDYKLLTVKDNGQAHDGTGPTFNGTDKDQYDLFDGTSDASITSAGQLIVVLNGVVQKPNASYDASGEGFALDGSDGIRFCDPPPSGSTLFVTQIGTATTLNVPADNSVTSAKIENGAIVNADINASADIAGSKLADDSIGVAKLDIHNAESGTDKFLGYTSNGMEWAVPADTNTNLLAGGTATGHINLDNDKELRLMEADSNGSAYVGLKGATDKGSESSYTLSLPAAAPTAGKALVANASTPTNLEWGTAGGASGGGTDQIFYENGKTVTTNYTITNDFNAMSAGPITINDSVTVTIGDGETWTIV